jgi:hypothetical protein
MALLFLTAVYLFILIKMFMKKIWITIVGIGGGIIYGLLLNISALILAGTGDGSYIHFMIFSAPLGLLYKGINSAIGSCEGSDFLKSVLFFGQIPFLWGLAGFLTNTFEKIRQKVLISFMCIHYIGAIIALLTFDYVNWCKFFHNFSSIISYGSLLIYLLGQVWLWKRLLDTFGKKEEE